MAVVSALNPEQQQACELLQGQLLVLAGPGTGKTRVISHRYLNLMSAGIAGTESIVVLAYNEKAAREMEERISTLCQTGFSELHVGTFHAFALGVLRDSGGSLPLPRNFDIAGDVDRWSVMCEVLERLRPPTLYRLPRPRDAARDLVRMVERAKQEMVAPADYLALAAAMMRERRLGAESQRDAAAVYSAYQEELLGRGLLDFDDTIYWAVRLLETDEDVRAQYRARFTHLMVDEFQDTNYAQLRLVELLAGEAGNIAVVGDDDQSIYKFRGASKANLQRFRRTYPGTHIVRLTRNYRSTQQVLDVSNRLIARDEMRVIKTITSETDGPYPRLYAAPTGDHEVAWVVERIAALMEGPRAVPAGEIAVLVRVNRQLRPFMRALQRAGVPYQLFGGRGFLDQPEIKDVRAFLQLASDPVDVQAACRILAMPGVALSANVILGIADFGQRSKLTIEDAAQRVELAAEARAAITRVLEILADVRAVSLRERADEVVFRVLELTRYVNLLDYPSEIQRRQAGVNVEHFYEMSKRFSEQDRTGERSSLKGFVDYLHAMEESETEIPIPQIEAGEHAVQLMTIHRAKGLEFTAVFMPGLVEERFPQKRRVEALPLPVELIKEEAPARDAHLGEERRLAYVGLTRARTFVHLSHAERYDTNKRWKPSRFLVDMGLMPDGEGNIAFPPATEAPPAMPPEPDPRAAQAALPMAHPDVRELVVSYSQLAQYKNCPRAYQYEYVYHLPTRISPEQQFGVIVHEALRQISALGGDEQPPLADALAAFDRIFSAQPFSDPVNADLWQERGRDFIRALHQKKRLSGRDASVEVPFNLKLPGFRVQGRIDRIEKAKRGHTLIDYKTGEMQEAWQLERDLQLGLYSIAAKQVLGLDPVELAICYLEDATEVPVIKTTSQLEADRTSAEEAAAGIMAADFTPAPSTWKCQHCDFRLVCDAAL